jgi:flavodoxin I
MKKVGLIYSFNTNKTSLAAKKISEEWGGEGLVHINAETITEKEFMSFDFLILGVPTWFDGELPNYWDEFVPAIEDMDLSGKTMAIFGNGNQKGYPENFVDGIGIMANLMESCGARIVGFTSAEGYAFEHSQALRDKSFVGLALDYENQSAQINKKIKDWTKQIKKEFLSSPAARK